MKTKFLIGLAVVVFLGLFTAWGYYGIETETVRIVSTESDNIRTVRVSDNDTMVFRNEDAIIFFKWDSEDVQARASALEKENTDVEVRYYGWRVPIFSMFPNALSFERVE